MTERNEIKPGDMVWLGPDRSKFLETFGYTIYGGDIYQVKAVGALGFQLFGTPDKFESIHWDCDMFKKVPPDATSGVFKRGDKVWIGPDNKEVLESDGALCRGGRIYTVDADGPYYMHLQEWPGIDWPREPFQKFPVEDEDVKSWAIPGRKTIDVNEMAKHIEAITGEEAYVSQLYRYARSLGFKLEITVEKIDE